MTKSPKNSDFLKGFGRFSCIQVKVSGNRETPRSLDYGKCLETGKQQNPLNTKKCLETGKTAKFF